MDGSDAILIPSSYDAEIILNEVTLNDLYDLEVNSVYQVDFKNEVDKSKTIEVLQTVAGLGFIFNYRADYEGADAIVIAT